MMKQKCPSQKTADICTAYRQELQREADLQCQQKMVKSDIHTLARDVRYLAKEVKKACLMKKWESHAEESKEQRWLPEEKTYALCTELMGDQDLITDMLQSLHQQQSQVDSEVAKVMSHLKDYYAKS